MDGLMGTLCFSVHCWRHAQLGPALTSFCCSGARLQVSLSGDVSNSSNGASLEPEVLVKGCLVYIAGPDKTRNPNYMGPASMADIAAQIAGSVGPSGPNCEYLFGLAQYMRDMVSVSTSTCPNRSNLLGLVQYVRETVPSFSARPATEIASN